MYPDGKSSFDLQVTGSLIKASAYEIKEREGRRIIKPATEATFAQYNPMELYVPSSITSPHLRFLRLETDEDILSFINHWGLLEISRFRQHGHSRFDYIEDIRQEQAIFKTLIELDSHYKAGDRRTLMDALNQSHDLILAVIDIAELKITVAARAAALYVKSKYEPDWAAAARAYKGIEKRFISAWGDLDQKWADGKLKDEPRFNHLINGLIDHLLEELAHRGLKAITPDIYYMVGRRFAEWHLSSLLNTLYLMFWLDQREGLEYRRCNQCGKVFTSRKARKVFCSRPCAKAAHRGKGKGK